LCLGYRFLRLGYYFLHHLVPLAPIRGWDAYVEAEDGSPFTAGQEAYLHNCRDQAGIGKLDLRAHGEREYAQQAQYRSLPLPVENKGIRLKGQAWHDILAILIGFWHGETPLPQA